MKKLHLYFVSICKDKKQAINFHIHLFLQVTQQVLFEKYSEIIIGVSRVPANK